ncbi:MAG: MoaD/ThiS family protein [Planctomycetaceae bacterium]|nr:MoaD/ThiS family protein [Planctomycetales bacterium]MCB9925967.1 MoaD/ThiS family protein [Planctomycetaceae bacterium]
MPRVFIPPPMRSLTSGLEIVEVSGANLRQVIDNLEQRFPGIKQRLCQGDEIRPGLSVDVGGSVATLGLLQRTGADTEIHFLPAIGGG